MPIAAVRMRDEKQIRVCRDIPRIVRGHWEVQTFTICDGWVNCWAVEENGISTPETFSNRDAAHKAIVDHVANCMLAVEFGDMQDAPTMDEFQIVFVEA